MLTRNIVTIINRKAYKTLYTYTEGYMCLVAEILYMETAHVEKLKFIHVIETKKLCE
jgi:hypothetical protein